MVGSPTERCSFHPWGEAATERSELLQARGLVQDLLRPQPAIYWTDLLASSAIAWTSLVGLLLGEAAWVKLVCFFAAGLAFYRLAVFTHELSHLGQRGFGAFRLAWNLLAGLPLLMPAFFYDPHLDHHRRTTYGTNKDGEYLPLVHGPCWLLFLLFAVIPAVPWLAIIRFGLLTPIVLLSARLHDYVIQHASTLVIDPTYLRPLPKTKPKTWLLQEAACCGIVWAGGLALAWGVIPWVWLFWVYLLSLFVLGVNTVRTLAAHRYLNQGEPMTHAQQLLDSVTITGIPFLSELWAPLGLRFHSLHHLLPSVPYHSLAAAHRRLVNELPPEALYRRTVHAHLPQVLWLVGTDILKRSGERSARS